MNTYYAALSSREKPLFHKKNSLMIPFLLSHASDNTTSQNIGWTDAWAVPHLQFWRDRPPQSPLSLRPCLVIPTKAHLATEPATEQILLVRRPCLPEPSSSGGACTNFPQAVEGCVL